MAGTVCVIALADKSTEIWRNRTTYARVDKARVESGITGRLARAGEVAFRNRVPTGLEHELDFITDGGGDRVGREGQTAFADHDGLRCCGGRHCHDEKTGKVMHAEY